MIGALAGHINHGKPRIDLPGATGDVPAIQVVASHIDVCHDRAVVDFLGVEQLDGNLCRGCESDLKSAVPESFLDNALNERVVFDDQNNR